MALRVLVVDDVSSVRFICRNFFENTDLDVEVLEAESGEAAIEILDREAVDIVLCDHRMGAVTGLEVLVHALRHQPKALRCMMSGYADPELAQAAITEAKVHAFLEKPMDIEAMEAVLQREVVDRYLQSQKQV